MKNLFLTFIFCFPLYYGAQTISFTNTSGSNSITCLTPSIGMNAYCVGMTGTFTWVSPMYVATGSNVNIPFPGVYTVSVYVGNMLVTQTFVINYNVTLPISALIPSVQVSTASVGLTWTATAISPTVNMIHQFTSPSGGTYTTNTISAYYTPQTPGTFTHCLIDNTNGCKSCKEFTVLPKPTAIVESGFEAETDIMADQLNKVLVIRCNNDMRISIYNCSGNCCQVLNCTKGENRSATLEPGVYFIHSSTKSFNKKYWIAP